LFSQHNILRLIFSNHNRHIKKTVKICGKYFQFHQVKLLPSAEKFIYHSRILTGFVLKYLRFLRNKQLEEMEMELTKEAGIQKPKQPRTTWRYVLGGLLLCLAALACVGFGFFLYAIVTAPKLDLADISPDGYRTTVLDDSGQEMIVLAGE
jgi:hypothetical protein